MEDIELVGSHFTGESERDFGVEFPIEKFFAIRIGGG